MKSILFSVAVILFASTSAFAQSTGDPSTIDKRFDELIANKPAIEDSTRLRRLFDLTWDYAMHEYPEWASDLGYKGGEGRWTNGSIEAIDRRRQEMQRPLAVIRSIDRTRLSPTDRIDYDLYRRNLEQDLEGERFHGEYMPMNQLGGVQLDVPQTLTTMNHATVQDYEFILSRFRAVPELVDQAMVLLKRGLDSGLTPPRVTLRDVPDQVKNLVTDDPMKSPLLGPFREMPESIPVAEQERLKKEAIKIYRQQVAPSYEKLHGYLTGTYMPATRTSIGMSALPGGSDWYAYRVRRSTTTRLSPKEIHEIGLSEVKRIRGEMEKVMEETGFNGPFAKFLHFLRTDPQFFYTDTASLLQAYRDIAKRADPQLVRLFGKLPRLPYGVIAMPAYSEKSAPTAYYYSGSLAAGRPGFFYANTYNLSTRPKWEMEALTLHEAVPGHHLQIALAQEMEGGPEFRKYQDYTAFVEGWGLYSESLGEEMGFYTDPYSKFGQLTYEIWRAIRLVIDTGIHQFGWSREQAIEFFKENSSKSEHDITVEVDRYIVWPGQALAYKLGEMKIKELRKFATRELGDAFDVRAFHDEVLGHGALPLDVLDGNIREWVSASRRKK